MDIDPAPQMVTHRIINNRRRRGLQDVVARRGADEGSHHTLIMANVKLKLRKAKRKDQREPVLDVRKLKDPNTRTSFQIEIRNRFTVLQDHQELGLHHFKEAMLMAGKNVLSAKRIKTEEWISQDTWKRIDERKEKKKLLAAKSDRTMTQLKTSHATLGNEVKKCARADKKAYIRRMAEEAEVTASKQDIGTCTGSPRHSLKGSAQQTCQ